MGTPLLVLGWAVVAMSLVLVVWAIRDSVRENRAARQTMDGSHATSPDGGVNVPAAGDSPAVGSEPESHTSSAAEPDHETPSTAFRAPEGYTWWQLRRRRSAFEIPCPGCDGRLALDGDDSALSAKDTAVEVAPTWKAQWSKSPWSKTTTKVLSWIVAVTVGTLIGSVWLSVPFLWILVSGIAYPAIQPIVDAVIIRLDPGLTVWVWSVTCSHCGVQLYVAPGRSVVFFAAPARHA